MTTVDWIRDGRPFAGEADLEHPWATTHRLPILTTWHPAYRYEVALVTPSDTSTGHDSVEWPTEDEAAILAWILDLRLGYYNNTWRARMRQRPLDVDGTTNTLIFGKIAGDWHYRRASWERPAFFPGTHNPPAGPFTGPVGLVDLIHAHVYSLASDTWWAKQQPSPATG